MISSRICRSVVPTLLIASLFSISACVGWGRNKSDEFDRRVERSFYDDEDFDGQDQPRWDVAEPPSEPASDDGSVVQHRARPVVDPGARDGSVDEGPLMYLNRLTASLAGKPISGYALVWEDARVFASASLDEDSALGRLGYRPDHWRASGGQAMPVKVIADHGPAVEIETLSSDDAGMHCDGGVRGLMGAYRLRAFVPRGELVPVLHKEFTREFTDGSVAHMPPGVPIRPTEDGFFVRLGRGAIEVPGPEDIEGIALSYSEPGFPEERLTPAPMAGVLSPESPLRLAGESVQLRMIPGEAGKPRWVRNDAPDGGSRIFMGDRCMAVALVTQDPEPLSEEPMVGLGLSGLSAPAASGDYVYQVRSGAPALWPNGARAGETRSVARHSLQPEERGGLLCFTVMGVLNVCHNREDVMANDRVQIREDAGVVEEEGGEWGGQEWDPEENEDFEVVRDRRRRMLILEEGDTVNPEDE